MHLDKDIMDLGMYVSGLTSRNRRFPVWCVIIGWWLLCLGVFQWQCAYQFYQQEQNQLFLFTGEYVGGFLGKPAWLACLSGEVLTILFHYPLMGAVITSTALSALLGLFYLCLRTGLARWAVILASLLLTLLVAMCHFSFHYELSSTLCLIGALAMFVMSRPLLKKSWKIAFPANLVIAMMTYWMFGYGVWLYLLFSILTGWKSGSVVLFLSILTIPILKKVCVLPIQELYAYPGIGKPQLPNSTIETGFQIEHAYSSGNWDEVVRIVEGHPIEKEEIIQQRILLFFYNLVQAQRGNLPDVLLRYYPTELGTFITMSPESPLLLYRNMHELYYAMGDMTWAGNAAIKACASAPHRRSARMIQRLAESHLVAGDTAVARKYLRMLSKTGVYSDWAHHAVRDAQYRHKAYSQNRADSINSNTYVMMSQLMASNPRNEVALDYMLCSELLLKDIESFKQDYDRYCTKASHQRKIYQEALCVWLVTHDAPEEEWQRYHIDPQTRDRLAKYSERKTLEDFSDTYWYYYDELNPSVFH